MSFVNVPTFWFIFFAACLNLSKHALWPAWSPCEKLNRATFIPASINCSSCGISQHAGPRVQKILVRRLPLTPLLLMVSKVMVLPDKSGMSPVFEIMVEVFYLLIVRLTLFWSQARITTLAWARSMTSKQKSILLSTQRFDEEGEGLSGRGSNVMGCIGINMWLIHFLSTYSHVRTCTNAQQKSTAANQKNLLPEERDCFHNNTDTVK